MKYPITPEYLQNVPDVLVKLYLDLEADIINSICDRLNTGQANATALELIRELQRRGMPLKDIEKRIRKTLNISQKTLTSILEDAAMRNNTYYGTAYDALGIVQETAQIDAMAEEVEAITRQTQQQLQNITRSMGFGVRGMDGNITVSNIQDTYQKILDRAELKVLSTDCSYNVAIRDGVRDMANSGLIGDWVEYNDEDGNVYHRNRVDVAVRRAVMTGVTQISGRYAEQAAEDMETDLYEITAHSGARDKGTGWQNHKAWQGKVYSTKAGDKYPSIYAVCGLGEVDGLEGVNCRHRRFPFIEGFSERTYTDEQLENIDKPPITFKGKKYTAYEATQRQRQLETALRRVKRRLVAFKAAGDNEAYTADAARYRALNEEYEAFSKEAGLRSQLFERATIPEFGPKEAREALKVNK